MPILQDDEKLQNNQDYKNIRVYKTHWLLKKREMWYKKGSPFPTISTIHELHLTKANLRCNIITTLCYERGCLYDADEINIRRVFQAKENRA